ncbi:hypothetical protein FGADI_1419 [Fusarium gaditjirri]|uniref:Myb-like domain-containing protein n=1 Tax=Fusarium gaditjirri TaxID=282569 RepID=A0A8H4TL53_9HYPO|nr:hypothetical protein FGADI_1419 [Fusarium gaditjirri]
MPQFPIKAPTWAEYRQDQDYWDRMYNGFRETWYNQNSAVPGFVELPEDCVPRPPPGNQASSSRAGPNPNSPTIHCDKQLGKDCNKICCKPKPKARGRRVTIATASDEENGVVTDTEGNITDSSNRVIKGKMIAKGKGKDKAVQTESENESSATQTDDAASTDTGTSVLSFVACLKDPNWSVSEDCRLRSMKEAGETWAFISDSLRKTKEDVRARWKILQSQLRAKNDTDTTEEGSVDDTTDEDDEEDDGQESDEDHDEDHDDDEEEEGDEEEDEDEEDDDDDDDDNGEDDDDDDEAADDADDEDESDDNSSPLQTNAYLGKRDCALLATIDSKYKRSRWLEMQANFYNVTGRMVPLEALKARCERAEAEKSERSKTRDLERRMNRVEDWIAKQEREKSAGPEESEDSEDSNDTDESDDSDDSDGPEDSDDSGE